MEGMRRAIMPYFSMKCSAMSPMALPAATTLAPLSAMPLMSALHSRMHLGRDLVSGFSSIQQY